MNQKIKNLLIIILLIINISLILKQSILLKDITVNNISTDVIEKRISNISEEQKYKINIYFPITKYELLNNEITDRINKYLSEFKSIVDNKAIQKNQYYTLDILYTKYEYNDYISYIFRISTYTGGAHPNNIVMTISYNKKTNTLISINGLINENNKLLNILSNNSRKNLKNNDLFKDEDILKMMLDGTKPEVENFKNFAFSKLGLVVFFPQYQIAPYSYGEFNVVIPYSEIHI